MTAVEFFNEPCEPNSSFSSLDLDDVREKGYPLYRSSTHLPFKPSARLLSLYMYNEIARDSQSQKS